jgi:hypothetical protein
MRRHSAPRRRTQRPVRIACVDNTENVSLGVPLDKLTAALQKCYDEHFLPVWGYPVELYNTQRPKRSDWRLVYFDDSKHAEDLGFHELTDEGQPISRVFVKSTLANGEPVSVTASHELFEMVIDPLANLWADGPRKTLYGYEVSDPVEEDVFPVDGLWMCNFVHPAWFEPFDHPPGTKFDHLGLLKAPFTLRSTGYVTIMRRGKVKDVFGSPRKATRFAREDRRGHRSEYRRTG